ncbi:MAG: hypothetical protein IPJ07_01990 [Acidobacteria bacterium]|nr:hypothetical protein [Acidobacteriota bacterium]
MTVSLSGLHPAFIAGTLGQGGAERQLYYILKALKESGADPCLICLTQGEYWKRRSENSESPSSMPERAHPDLQD